MKGLLLKDFFTLAKSLRVFLLLIVAFACLPGYNMAVFAVVYASLLPVTALSYDERCKWDTLAAMSPYSAKELVISKYLLGYIAVAGAAALALLVQFVYSRLGINSGNDYLASIVGGAASGLLVMAISLPAIYKFGVEKGRIFFFVMVALLVGGSAAFLTMADRGAISSLPRVGAALGLVSIGAVVVINIVSILLSVSFYSKREF